MKKGHFMKPLSLFIIWLVGFFFITLLCIKFNGSTIEHELTQQTHQPLANNGSNSVTPSVNEDHLPTESVTNTTTQPNVDNLIDRSTAPITETNSNSVYPPQQTSITDQPIENHIVNKPNVLANLPENKILRPSINNTPWPNNANNFQMPLNNNGLNMPFWGNNNTPWGNGFMPPIPIQPIAPITPTAPVFPFETFYPMPMQ